MDSDGGRPRVLLQINPDYGYVVGVDVGEIRVRVELFDLTMTERAKADYPLDPRQHGVDVIVEAILTGLTEVLARGGVSPSEILGIGVGVPGIVENGPGGLVHGQAYGWEWVPLERLLRAGTSLPLHIDNGAKTMGQAELWFGAGRGAQHAVVCLIGSGVGASIIAHGSTQRGSTSSAGEWGHTTVMVGGRTCRCGARGCLEAYVGAEAILDRYGSPLPGAQPGGRAHRADRPGRDVCEGGRGPGRDRAVPWRQHRRPDQPVQPRTDHPRRMGRGLLLGGQMLPAIREAARTHALRHPFAQTSIEVGRLGPHAVALGAATLPIEALLSGTAFAAKKSDRPAS